MNGSTQKGQTMDQSPPTGICAEVDPLLRYIQTESLPLHLQHIPQEIRTKGYAVIPGILTKEECEKALNLMWNFVQDVSGNMVKKDDPHSWYPKHQLRPTQDETFDGIISVEQDPWPHTGYSSFPDMFQSLGAGYLLGPVRELIAERIFEPLLGTKEIHSSKEGFTFARPTSVEIDGVEHRWMRPKEVMETKVCGKVQPNSIGEHYDQSHDTHGLHTIQSSCCFLDQNENNGDGHFACYPYSHSETHASMTRNIYRGKFPWIPLTEQEVSSLPHKAEHIYCKQGDVIIWRSDLVHAAVPPADNTKSFRAVAYFSMSPASWTPDYPNVWQKKIDSYRCFKTGDHRSFIEDWHEHKRNGNDWIIARQRPYYRYSPPLITPRLAELYGLIPYRLEGADYEKAIERAIIRGIRFVDNDSSLDFRMNFDHPLCSAKIETFGLKDGTCLPGQDKFLGGMCSPTGKFIYGVPGHAKRTLMINTETNEMSLIGPSFKGQFKWLRGLEVPSHVMGDYASEYPEGCCLALPSNMQCILKINCATNDVKTFGEIEEEGWLYHGGNLASDGFVYAIPANASRVLKIDPRKETIEYIGPIYKGRQKWFGGILGSDGCIYGIPQNSAGVLRIDPLTPSCSILGEGLLEDGQWKFHGGLAVKDGKIIIGFPNNADSILVIDVERQMVFTVGDSSILQSGRHRIPQDRRYKYLGGAATLDGRYSYLFPCDAERVLRIDNDTFELKLVGPQLLEGENKYQNGFVSRDGCLYGIPQRASGVLRIIPSSVSGLSEDVVDVLYCGDEMVGCKDKFEGGVIDLEGNIYCVPLRAKKLLKVIPGEKFGSE